MYVHVCVSCRLAAGIKFYPSLAHDAEDVKLTLDAFEASVIDVLEERDGRVL